MKVYKIFLKRTEKGVIEDLEIIEEGLNIFAMVFNFFYLLYRKLWKQAGIIFVIFGIINYFTSLDFIPNYAIFAIQLSILIYVGFECNDWIANKLIGDSYEFLGYSSGNNVKEAKLKFLENINQNYKNNDKLEKKIF